MPEATIIGDGRCALARQPGAEHATRFLETAIAEKLMGRCIKMAPKAGLQVAGADTELRRDVSDPDRLTDTGADQLAGTSDLTRSWIEPPWRRVARQQPCEDACNAMEQ